MTGINPAEVRPVILGCVGATIIAVRWFHLRRRLTVWSLFPALLCVVYVFLRAWLFDHTYTGTWYSLDSYLYYADQGFGFDPSLAANHLIERAHLFPAIEVIYESLMLAIAITYAYSLGRNHWRVFAMLVLAGLLGAQAYRLLPACGPVYLLGSECYLGTISCGPITSAYLHPVALSPMFPRNAIPSMHIAWALLVFFVWRSSRFRYVAALYVALTTIATLGGGEHYLVDLIAAVPFSVSIWALCLNRPLIAGTATLGFFGWIGAIRFNPQVLHESPALTWAFAIALLIGSAYGIYRTPENFCEPDQVNSELGQCPQLNPIS